MIKYDIATNKKTKNRYVQWAGSLDIQIHSIWNELSHEYRPSAFMACTIKDYSDKPEETLECFNESFKEMFLPETDFTIERIEK